VSPIGLYWKDDTSFPELNGNGSHTKTPQDPATSPNKKNENEVKNDHPQLTKRLRNKPTPRDQDFLWTT